MKKLITITLLSIYLISTTEICQLAKLPILVEHFIAHKKADSKLTLWGFLCMHYATEKVHDGDDMKLPFKSGHATVGLSVVAIAPNIFPAEVPSAISYTIKPIPLTNDNFLSSLSLASIWQPPKSC